MKLKIYLIFLLSLSLFLGGCSFDESLESTQQHDGDDINVLQNIGPQALDQMLYGKSVSTIPLSDHVIQPSSLPSQSKILPQQSPTVIPSPSVSQDVSVSNVVSEQKNEPSLEND